MSNAHSPVDAFIHTAKSAFMQRVADLVRTGHTSYASGEIDLLKYGFLSAKFEERFQISRGKLEASRARKRGEHSARLLAYLPENATAAFWVLLYCPGKVADTSEKWRDAYDHKITLTGYELVRLTKEHHPNPVHTWRYKKERYEELREACIFAIRRKRDDELRQLIHTIWRSPGFGGVRAQVKKIGDAIKTEWKRTRGKEEAMPEIPAHLGYVQRIADKGKTWRELTRKTRVKSGKQPEEQV